MRTAAVLSFAVTALAFVAPWVVGADASLSGPRIAAHDGYTRVVLDFQSPPTFTSRVNGQDLTMEFTRVSARTQTIRANTRELKTWSLEARSGTVFFKLSTNLNLARGAYHVFTIPAAGGAPHRLVVDLGEGVGKASAASASNAASADNASAPSQQTSAPSAGSSRPANPLPAVTATSAPTARPPARRVPIVVLDPGHGGVDSGAVGYVVEKKITLTVALKIRDLLEKAGVQVVMTRSTDWAWQRDGSLEEKRRDLQQRANFASTEKHAFISIHVNSGPASAQGVETFVFGQPLEATTLAQAERENGGGALGRLVTNEALRVARDFISDQLAQENLRFSRKLADAVQGNLVAQTRAVSRGVKPNALYVIRYARIPSILVEIGFGSHPTEGRNLGQDAYQNRIASGVSTGILRFLGM